MPESPEQFRSEGVPEVSPEVERGQPIDSWTKEQFIENGKFLLEGIRKMAPDVAGKNHGRSIFASIWIADHIRALYKYMERGKFSLGDLGVSKEDLREMVAPSKGFSRPLTEEERNEIWQRVLEKSQ